MPEPARIACVLLMLGSQACATSTTTGGPSAGGAAAADEVVRPEVVDVCAQFAREQQSALSADEHMRTYGCPPCPCHCSDGRITCAPCAACGSFQSAPDLESPPDRPGG